MLPVDSWECYVCLVAGDPFESPIFLGSEQIVRGKIELETVLW